MNEAAAALAAGAKAVRGVQRWSGMNAALSVEAVGLALVVSEPCMQGDDAVAALRSAGFAVVDDTGADAEVIVVCSSGPAAERIAAVVEATHDFPDRPIVATMPADASGRQLRQAILAGASGIVFDDRVSEAIAATAFAALSGQLAVPLSVARRLAPRPLSHREKEVMALVARGYTNRQIARQLFLAESTIKTHLSSALRKLDVHSRAEAAALVLDPDEGHDLTLLEFGPWVTKDR